MEEENKKEGYTAERYMYLERIHTKLREHLTIVRNSAPMSSGTALREQNMYMFAYFQSSLMLATDLLDILDGKPIKSIAEIDAEMKRIEKEEKEKENLNDITMHG